MKLNIQVLTAPLSEEQIFDLGVQFTDAINQGTPVRIVIDNDEYPVHPVDIDREAS